MRAVIQGVLLAVLAAFVYFHDPAGNIVAVDPENGQVILKPSPPGYLGHTLIQTGAGTIIVEESICDVAKALQIPRSCNMRKSQ